MTGGLNVPNSKDGYKSCIPCVAQKGNTCKQNSESPCYSCKKNGTCWRQQPCERWDDQQKARYLGNFSALAYKHPSPGQRIDLLISVPYRLDYDTKVVLKLWNRPGSKDLLGEPPKGLNHPWNSEKEDRMILLMTTPKETETVPEVPTSLIEDSSVESDDGLGEIGEGVGVEEISLDKLNRPPPPVDGSPPWDLKTPAGRKLLKEQLREATEEDELEVILGESTEEDYWWEQMKVKKLLTIRPGEKDHVTKARIKMAASISAETPQQARQSLRAIRKKSPLARQCWRTQKGSTLIRYRSVRCYHSH